MNADSRLRNEIKGLNHNKSIHQSIFQFDPVLIFFILKNKKFFKVSKCKNTGIPVTANLRLQLNIYLENNGKYK
jgi:hypothetical protein